MYHVQVRFFNTNYERVKKLSKVYGYIRVSTSNQKTDRQYEALEKYSKDNNINYDIIFEDKVSGKHFDRPQYNVLKEKAIKGDTIIVKELDRLGRNYDEIKVELDYFYNKGIKVIIIDIPMLDIEDETMSKVVNDIVINMLSYIAQKEREKISQRVKEGIKAARANGVEVGRPTVEIPKAFYKYYDKWKAKEITGVEFAKLVEVSRSTLYRHIKLHEEKKAQAS